MSDIDMERCEPSQDGILYCPQGDQYEIAYYVRNVYPPIQPTFHRLRLTQTRSHKLMPTVVRPRCGLRPLFAQVDLLR
ncbi:hypothetical protein KIN20_034635 [Parelaphostrongylus tenuis]|uniref:Uncharacterized protein n=1 Tax=Parelaphostrongylus tenuis TaxID=148309 RepID=A0AAD5RAQ0_PARTN|nr:hypothetical protein KIN20_034635 [Parelaphostrongylus tenuis]